MSAMLANVCKCSLVSRGTGRSLEEGGCTQKCMNSIKSNKTDIMHLTYLCKLCEGSAGCQTHKAVSD